MFNCRREKKIVSGTIITEKYSLAGSLWYTELHLNTSQTKYYIKAHMKNKNLFILNRANILMFNICVHIGLE